MEETLRKLEDVALQGSWALGWEGLTFKGSELGCPILSISARKELEMERLGGESQSRQPTTHPHAVSGLILRISHSHQKDRSWTWVEGHAFRHQLECL